MFVYIGTHPKELLKGWVRQHNVCGACSRAFSSPAITKTTTIKKFACYTQFYIYNRLQQALV